MSFEKFLFYVFAAITLAAATLVVTRRNPVHAVLFLVLAFFNAAALWLLMEAEFLAIALVLVYVGAVMVLFLFVVMMLDIDLAALREGFVRYLPVGALVGLIMAAEMVLVYLRSGFGSVPAPVPHAPGYANTEVLGELLFTRYLYPLEIAGAILVVGIVAAIGLTLRRRADSKYQDPSRQVRVKKGPDRIQVVSMPAEKENDL